MKPRHTKPVKLVEFADLFEEDSFRTAIENGEPWGDEVARMMADIQRGEWQAKQIVALVPTRAQDNILRHNAAALALRDRIRFLSGARPCFKCKRLFVDPDLSHRGCWPCYAEYVAALPPLPHDYADDQEFDDPESSDIEGGDGEFGERGDEEDFASGGERRGAQESVGNLSLMAESAQCGNSPADPVLPF